MSGKQYSIRELKMIVDYIVEQKAYGRVKGKKLWIDFANSQLTNRTWQSLKQSYLKNVLPDIHNPYYKLTAEQINSFRRGFDVEERSRDKLEVRREISEESSNGNTHEEGGETNIDMKTEVDKATGEDVISKTLNVYSSNRSSIETVVLEAVYKSPEDIQRVLESPSGENNALNRKDKSPAKSLRDLIIYTEPLTPMLQEVLDDFASESEGEPQMQIVEDNSKQLSNAFDKVNKNRNVSPERNEEASSDAFQINVNKPFRGTDIQTIVEKNIENNTKESSCVEKVNVSSDCNDNVHLNSENDTNKNTKAGKPVHNTTLILFPEKTIENTTQNSSSYTTDSGIPNNQEGFVTKILSATESSKCSDTQQVVKVNKQMTSNSTSGAEKSEIKKKTITLEITKDIDKDKEVSTEKEPDNINNVLNKPRKNSEPKETEAPTTDTSNRKSVQNPCLQSVSLFIDNSNVMNVSELSLDEVSPATQVNGNINNLVTEKVDKQVIVLNSHSESASSNSPQKSDSAKTTKQQRHKAFDNLFGFTSGAVSIPKSKLKLHRRRNPSFNVVSDNNSHTSEWTSDDDDDQFVAPPRARKNRTPARKYLKPKSARIVSLEKEGGLFATYYKKLLPLVKDGKIIKGYLTYAEDSDSAAEEDYWKQKYAEEKQKLEEERKKSEILMKLLEKSKEPKPRELTPPSTVTPSRSVSKEVIPRKISSSSGSVDKATSSNHAVNKKDSTENVKIKYTRNNEEIEVEGQWQNIHTVLQQAMQILHKDVDNEKKNSISTNNISEEKRQSISRATTPSIATDPAISEVSNKVARIEDEIFKQIEQMEREENTESSAQEFVTKRRGKGRKMSASSAGSPSKKQCISAQIHEVPTNNIHDVQASTSRPNIRTPRKAASDIATRTHRENTIQTRKSKRTMPFGTDENDIRYKLPRQTRKTNPDVVNNTKEQESKKLRRSRLRSSRLLKQNMQIGND